MSVDEAQVEPAPLARIEAPGEIEFSESLANIAKALIRAQSSMDEVFKDSTNPHFRSKYAALPACLNAVKPALLANGIALVQAPTSSLDASVVYVTTMFLHESGEWMRCRLGLQPQKEDPQGAGSAITYGRRYTLLAMCGVAPEDDDDGNAASGGSRNRPGSSRTVQPPPAAPEPRKGPETGAQDAKDRPGSASTAMKDKLAQQIALLGLDSTLIARAFHDATARDDAASLNDLSWNEGVALAGVLKGLGCACCGAKVLDGEDHLYDGYGMPCDLDVSEAANHVRANAVTRDSPRGPAATLEDETELSPPI